MTCLFIRVSEESHSFHSDQNYNNANHDEEVLSAELFGCSEEVRNFENESQHYLLKKSFKKSTAGNQNKAEDTF